MPHTLFISDLHLSPETPAATDALLRFLRGTAPDADALYVLGDLFEYWIGDEGLAQPFARQVAQAFRTLADGGVPIYFMHGNRDFLLGERFALASGMTLLTDPTVVDLYGTPTLLMHGDTLCSDDVEYQKFRAMVRNPVWQRAFLAKPLDERVRMAREVRGKSEQAKQVKEMTIMDVAPATVADAFRAHDYARLIHGHTHRPARHEHKVDGRECERWVLADWYNKGSYLLCDAGGCRAQPLD
ncbi:MAG TPA: UDP-2,3-diacylglucosamine diphosphatase [Burkholderiales bacterium]|nr:UDP-2,3-diacylglucosamine diphosphatase [Burkholderiales bacterium]